LRGGIPITYGEERRLPSSSIYLRPYPKTYDIIQLKRTEVNKNNGTNTTVGSQ